jgi:hypothetical protein
MTSASVKSLRRDVAPLSAQYRFLGWQPVGYSTYYSAFARSFGSASLVLGSPALFRLSVPMFSLFSEAVVVRLFSCLLRKFGPVPICLLRPMVTAMAGLRSIF